MKRITEITLFALGLAGLAGLAVLVSPALVKAANENFLTFDVACDCRTGSPGFFSGNRGDVFIVSGNVFDNPAEMKALCADLLGCLKT